MSNAHNRALGLQSGRFMRSYVPLSADEARAMISNPRLQDLTPEVLENFWIRPACRILQQVYDIDPSCYPDGDIQETNGVGGWIPTRAELDRDFQIAVVIYIEKLADNPEDVIGVDEGRNFDTAIPGRAAALLEPYRTQRRGRIRRG